VYTVRRLLGLSRNGSYEAAKRGDIPTLRIGRLLMVPKAPFHRLLELTATGTAVPAKDGVSKRSQSYNVETAAGEEEGPET
jgi:hypothetical protein